MRITLALTLFTFLACAKKPSGAPALSPQDALRSFHLREDFHVELFAARHTREELLTSILNPGYAIEPQFTHYIVTTKDGHVHDGVLAHETPALITLRGGTEEGDETILRANIQEIRASSISLMPEELEKSVSRPGLADVIAYLRGGL
jgi:putative heme-binding domain-containing protein